MAAGSTRRRRRRVGGLLVALALLAGLVTAPHVVLAAAGDPGEPAIEEASAKDCLKDHEVENQEAGDPDDAVEANDDDENDEDEREEAEEGTAKGRDDTDPALDGSRTPRPTPTRPQPAPDPSSPVLGS